MFISGCEHRCTGCFSEETWDKNMGHEFTDNVKASLFKSLELNTEL
ncbi:MAG: 4Fe-4S cluster-binding domain-containing protein [Mycoplasma sp.]